MSRSIEEVILAIESLPIDELRTLLNHEIDKARLKSDEVRDDIAKPFYLDGPAENVMFDRLTYFKELTKNFELSISDCKLKLNINYEEIKKTSKKLEETDSQARSLFTSFTEAIKDILTLLTKGNAFDIMDDQPLKKLERALINNQEVSYSQVEEVIYSINYEPRGISRLYNSVYVKDGEFENYLKLRDKVQQIYKDISSDNFTALQEKHSELLKERDKLYSNPSKIRAQMIDWRKAAIKCFNAQYNESQLTTNSLMMTYE